ncbi:hypothetical protein Tco_1166457 [Tanacetum coccineum]
MKKDKGLCEDKMILLCSDELDSSSSSFVEEIVSSKGPPKALLKWYDDATDEDIEEFFYEAKKQGKRFQLSSPSNSKSKGKGSSSTTSKSRASNSPALPTSKIPPTPKNHPKQFVVKSPIQKRNYCIGLANKTTWDMILKNSFGVTEQEREHERKGKRKLGV